MHIPNTPDPVIPKIIVVSSWWGSEIQIQPCYEFGSRKELEVLNKCLCRADTPRPIPFGHDIQTATPTK